METLKRMTSITELSKTKDLPRYYPKAVLMGHVVIPAEPIRFIMASNNR